MTNRGIVSGLVLAAGLYAPFAFADDSATTQPASDTTTTSSTTDQAKDALKQKSEDASTEKNLEQVFQATEKTYSLQKAGKVSLLYDVDYSYYRDSRIDIAISDNSSQLTRFRIEEDAQHTFTNMLELGYGVWDNLTFVTDLPLIVKFDSLSNSKTTGLGDVSFGVRWQPIPLKRGLPTTTLFATLSTASGDSPYDINVAKDLSTGKGYYSLSGGASVSKLADPIVLFASGSYSMNSNIGGLNQNRGGRYLSSVSPGDSLGFSMGLAYSLNYDVSVTASYQQSYAFATVYEFTNGDRVNTSDQTSASLNFSLGLRTNPKRIINLSVGYGLTPDTPDVTLGFSMPIDFMGSSDE
jgi:hypothetical protein